MAILVKITDEQGNLLREVEVDAGHSLKINPGEKVVLAGIDPEDVEIETVGNDLVLTIGDGEPIVFENFVLYLADKDSPTTLTIGEGEDAEEIASLEDLEVEPEAENLEEDENIEESLDTAAGGGDTPAPAPSSGGTGSDGSIDSPVTGDTRISAAFDLLSSGGDDASGTAGGSSGQAVISPVTTEEAPGPEVTVGRAIDGYIKDATVFADANLNGEQDDGEAFTTTDENGEFTLVGGTGPLVMVGGTDTATDLPFTGVLTAPAGSSVVSPLTTDRKSVV